MDLLPKVGGPEPYQPDQRQGGGGSRRHARRDRQQVAQPGANEPPPSDVEAVDPLLAELDRLRVVAPELTDSGTHRAMLALRAYQPPPEPVVDDPDSIWEPPPVGPDAASHITTRVYSRRGRPTGSGPTDA
jgi:hypothetical protein